MQHHILLVLASNFLVFCSSVTDTMESANIVGEFQEDDDGEEEITAIPPTVITGAHLVCLPKFEDENSQTIKISCHFEKDGEVLKDISIKESDFDIHYTNGENLIISSTKDEDGKFIFGVNIKPGADINISIKTIDGVPFAQQNSEDFSDVIDSNEIKQAQESRSKSPNLESTTGIKNEINQEKTELLNDSNAPSAPSDVDDGIYTTSSKISPSVSWTASTDLETGVDRYEVSIGSSVGNDNVRVWENVGNVTSKIFADLDLGTGGRYFVNVRAVDLAGNVSESSTSDGFIYDYCKVLETPGSWILIPGDPDYGTDDFCVMKYEAKNSSNNPSSQSSETPWVEISQVSAKSECESLGPGYHLITNPEWMTIASNAANVDENWSLGNVGSGELARGHSDKSPNLACAASPADINAYVQDNCSGLPSGTFNQRRTQILSNGEVIWDLSGNVHELVDYFNKDDKPAMADPNDYSEFTDVITTATTTLKDLIPTNNIKSYWNDSWNSSQSIGKYWSGTNGTTGVMLRGSEYDDETVAGLFDVDFDFELNATHSDVGFRCTFVKP